MRELRDVDWVQRQMLARMEKRFEFQQISDEEIMVYLGKKLLSNGIVKYHLDGVERPFR
jgi:hypothetical protein